jgi:protein transport protein SEC24
LYIQTSILYSYGDGNRRIRIHNLCVPCIKNLKTIFEGIDSETLAILYMKKIIDSIYRSHNFSNSILEVENMFYKLINGYFECIKTKEKNLSENLIYLPIFMLGIMKQRIFCKNEIEKKYDIDLSNFIRIKVIRFQLEDCLPFIYPRIYNLTELYENEELGNFNNENIINLPNLLADSINYLSNDGLYLIDNGYLFILYIRQNNGNEIIKSLFNVEDINEYNNEINENNIFENCENGSFKERVYNIIEYIRSTKSLYQNLVFIFSGTPSEKLINEALIEDNCCSWYPYDYEKFYKKMISSGLNTNIYK